jgi:pyruvate formate lyase activating enzyme
LTDAVENVEAIADIVVGLQSVERVEVLPFHQLGRFKWAATGEPYLLGNTGSPDAELLERVREQFRARGLTTY